MKAARRLIELAQSEGVDRVFGNPGTTELPFMDELAKVPEFQTLDWHRAGEHAQRQTSRGPTLVHANKTVVF